MEKSLQQQVDEIKEAIKAYEAPFSIKNHVGYIKSLLEKHIDPHTKSGDLYRKVWEMLDSPDFGQESGNMAIFEALREGVVPIVEQDSSSALQCLCVEQLPPFDRLHFFIHSIAWINREKGIWLSRGGELGPAYVKVWQDYLDHLASVYPKTL